MAPTIIDPSIRRKDERRDSPTVTPESLIRDAHTLLRATGVTRGSSWVARAVRDFLATHVDRTPFGEFLASRVEMNQHQRRILAERADLRYLLTYSDPTGETAVRNVSRGDGR